MINTKRCRELVEEWASEWKDVPECVGAAASVVIQLCDELDLARKVVKEAKEHDHDCVFFPDGKCQLCEALEEYRKATK